MSDSLQARIRALELALMLEGSMKYKMEKAEEFHDFLQKGVYIPIQYPYITPYVYTDSVNLPITIQTPTVTF